MPYFRLTKHCFCKSSLRLFLF